MSAKSDPAQLAYVLDVSGKAGWVNCGVLAAVGSYHMPQSEWAHIQTTADKVLIIPGTIA